MKTIPLTSIRTDGGTQPRESIDEAVVAEYRERMEEGDDFPPVDVFYDGTDYWLADGFHRVNAAKSADFKSIGAKIHQGTQRDAVLFSVGANVNHGARRTNADKRRAVTRLLSDAEWVKWSNSEIARRCGVNHHMVADARVSLGVSPSEGTYRTKHGTTATMNTANIGRKPTTKSTEIVNTNTGEVLEDAAVVTTTVSQSVAKASTDQPARPQRRGRGIELAHDAINILKQIPVNDALRAEGLNTVARWIRDNK